MVPNRFIPTVLDKALRILPKSMDTQEARVIILAIGLQESKLTARRQVGGPARGLWQFEAGGGVRGVLQHPASADLAKWVCYQRGVRAVQTDVYSMLDEDDILAAAFARLLLWSDPKPLPTTGQEALALYLRTWRPGKPHPETWPAYFLQAQQAVMG